MAEINATMLNVVDREILVTRVFDAPRDLVWKVWTESEHIGQWWGPIGFTTTTEKMDVQSGGEWKFIMHGPDGRDYYNKIIYIEVVKPERLVYRHAGDKETKSINFLVTVIFIAQGNKTKATMQMVFPTAAELKYVNDTYGAIEGAKQNIDRLAEYLETMKQ